MHALELFLAFVKTQFNTTIKVVKYDNEGDFRPFTKYLTELGIYHILAFPLTSHQNGSVEIKPMSIIVEMRLTLLSHVFMPLKFWNHSFMTTAYLINRFPTSTIVKFNSPFHTLHNKEPD